MPRAVLVFLALTGCDSLLAQQEAEDACTAYQSAFRTCAEEAYANDSQGLAKELLAIADPTCGIEAGRAAEDYDEATDLYTCLRGILDNADCRDPQTASATSDTAPCFEAPLK